MMSSLASFVVRRRRAVITFWIVLLLAAGTVGSAAFSVLSSSFGAGPGTESGRVTERLDDLAETGGEIAIIADGIDIDDPATAPPSATDSNGSPPSTVWSPSSTRGRPDRRAARQRRSSRPAVVTDHRWARRGGRNRARPRDRRRRPASTPPRCSSAGTCSSGNSSPPLSENDLLRGEAIALPIAFVAMIFLLGGLRAAGMPFLVALAGVITSLAVLVAATMLGDVSIFSINVVNMLGIGLGIDYGLLMINRFREERGRGRDLHDAVARTVAPPARPWSSPPSPSPSPCAACSCSACRSSPRSASPASASSSCACPPRSRCRPPPSPPSAARSHRRLRSPTSRAASTGSPGGCRATPSPSAAPRWSSSSCSVCRSSAPASRSATPAPCPARRRCDVALTLADRFPARGTDPVTVIADTDPDSAEFVAWLGELSTTPGVVGASVRPDTPAAVTVVDITPAGTSQGREASELVAQLRDTQPTFDTEVGGIAAELIDVKARLSERLPFAPTPGRPRHAGAAVPHDRLA